MLLNGLDMINEIKFVHPKDMQDGKVTITANDITTNLPYVPGAHIALTTMRPRSCATRADSKTR